MTRFQSISNPAGAMPRIAILPPLFILSIICRNAGAAPDISSPMSNPSRMPIRSMTVPRSVSATLTASAIPMLRARSRRTGFTSVMTTLRAPAALATIAPMMPMGPAPVTSTSSPTQSKLSAVWTALPKGSKIAAISSGMSSGIGTTLLSGRHR